MQTIITMMRPLRLRSTARVGTARVIRPARYFMLGLYAAALVACHRGPASDTETVGSQARHPRLDRRQPLPEPARELLRDDMMRHGQTLEQLLWSAVMLEHAATADAARDLLTQPRIPRPAPTTGEPQRGQIPMSFFDLQDRMYAAASELHRAATARDDMAAAKAYGDLTQTCIACHSIYLHLGAEPGDQANPSGSRSEEYP